MSDNEMLLREYAAMKKAERHRNLQETRYWCDQYKSLAKRLIDNTARPALTDEQVREIAERHAAEFKEWTEIEIGAAWFVDAIREAIGSGEK